MKGFHVASTNDLKNGMVLDLDGQLWQVLWFQHHKPGKGNTVVRTKLKHVLSGKVVDRTFNSDTKVDTATVDRREMQYLYHDGDGYVFMDTATYDQLTIPDDTVGDAKGYLLENGTATVAMHEGNPCTSTCRPRSNSRSPTPSPACRATGPPVAPSPPPSRPACRFRCRCSSPPANGSRWTPATAATWVGSELCPPNRRSRRTCRASASPRLTERSPS